MLKDLISKYIEEINAADIKTFEDRAAEVEKFRIRFLGRKGVMNELFEQFKALPNEQKKEMGVALNQLKTAALAKVEEFKTRPDDAGRLRSAGQPSCAVGDDERDCRNIFPHRLHHRGVGGDRGRLASLLGAELSS